MALKVFYTKLAIVLIASTILLMMSPANATFRKPPFNGSIFGKRSGSINTEYDPAGKALSAMCEIASEACSSWFPSQEK
ncbi:FMRFamide-related neuropeptides [Dendroctonus ponderosae]|uniref:SIFamide n=1 Tax=Dendroctonus ponderosae TaxID=77166 RepID=U4UED8_DENPD|nr:FMRFamide-related neuropeptides [Dendroctonus ponderosae]ERL92324.1 hypothetical protein D910_09641 [Dendroctonus ponderosae]KAH1007933.1 hypothetical protein HUJ04_005104 [Dendroctonus ponderosae]KAH1015434.1 hypothetical protein HUJ05_013157 [Dendroctonus ponderosae]